MVRQLGGIDHGRLVRQPGAGITFAEGLDANHRQADDFVVLDAHLRSGAEQHLGPVAAALLLEGPADQLHVLARIADTPQTRLHELPPARISHQGHGQRRPSGRAQVPAIARDLADYQAEMPSATACFGDDFEACIAHLRMPITHRRAIRTTNLLERLFVEERRRLKIIANAFGEKAVLKLMFGAMIRAAERWRAIRVSELERRQMRAVREELDHGYEAQNGLGTKASAPAHPAQSFSTSRT